MAEEKKAEGLIHVEDLKVWNIVYSRIYDKTGKPREEKYQRCAIGEYPLVVFVDHVWLCFRNIITWGASRVYDEDDSDNCYYKPFDMESYHLRELIPGMRITNKSGDTLIIDIIENDKVYTTNRWKGLDDDERIVWSKGEFVKNMLLYEWVDKTKGKIKMKRSMAAKMFGSSHPLYFSTETPKNNISKAQPFDIVYKKSNMEAYVFIEKLWKGIVVTQDIEHGEKELKQNISLVYYHKPGFFCTQQYIERTQEELREKMKHEFDVELVDW